MKKVFQLSSAGVIKSCRSLPPCTPHTHTQCTAYFPVKYSQGGFACVRHSVVQYKARTVPLWILIWLYKKIHSFSSLVIQHFCLFSIFTGGNCNIIFYFYSGTRSQWSSVHTAANLDTFTLFKVNFCTVKRQKPSATVIPVTDRSTMVDYHYCHFTIWTTWYCARMTNKVSNSRVGQS